MTQRKNKSNTNQGNKVNPSSSSEALITKDFFAQGISINEKEIFPMVVMATMSSGKSTLINSLLGQQILPSRNAACTAKMYSILDDDQADSTKIYITYKNGDIVIKEENVSEQLEAANGDDEVASILIRGCVKGVHNTDKALLIVDTPGPNNACDESHQQVMPDVMRKIKGGLILYVLNATQLGINDDKKLLGITRDYIKENPRLSVLFVINKVDQYDEEKEGPVRQLILSVNDYLKENGIENPQIIPVSALAASLFKKALNKEKFTRSEYRSFCNYYEMFKPQDYNMKSYAITTALPNQLDTVEVRGEKYLVGELNRAIENTGIKLLEEEIQKAQILSGGVINNTIKIHRGSK